MDCRNFSVLWLPSVTFVQCGSEIMGRCKITERIVFFLVRTAVQRDTTTTFPVGTIISPANIFEGDFIILRFKVSPDTFIKRCQPK